LQLNQLYNNDCLKILKDNSKIENNSIQLIFADPPYNLSGNGLKNKNSKTGGDFTMVNEEWDKMSFDEYIEFTNSWIEASKRVLKPNGSIFISCTHHNIAECTMGLKQNGFEIKNIITWHKTNAMPNLTRRVLTHSSEFIIWAVKGKGWIFNYEILKKLNPDKKQDGTDKQMRDVWTLPLCPFMSRKRENKRRRWKSTSPNPKTRRVTKKDSFRIFK